MNLSGVDVQKHARRLRERGQRCCSDEHIYCLAYGSTRVEPPVEHSLKLFLRVWLQASCDSADTQCLGAVGVDVEAVIAQALVHTVQV